jgi:hypothetical protein
MSNYGWQKPKVNKYADTKLIRKYKKLVSDTEKQKTAPILVMGRPVEELDEDDTSFRRGGRVSNTDMKTKATKGNSKYEGKGGNRQGNKREGKDGRIDNTKGQGERKRNEKQGRGNGKDAPTKGNSRHQNFKPDPMHFARDKREGLVEKEKEKVPQLIL